MWEKLYEMEAAYKPKVNDELDTQNFMEFDEVCRKFSLFIYLALIEMFSAKIDFPRITLGAIVSCTSIKALHKIDFPKFSLMM